MSGVLLAHEPAETLSVRDIRTQRARCSVTINTSLLLHLSYSLQTNSKSQHISTGDGNQTETEPKFESNRTEPNEPNLQCCMRVPSVIRPIDVSRKLLSFTGEHCFRFFVNTRFHQPRRGRPWNVYRRFGRRWSFINGSRDLAHPFPIFTGGGTKVRNLASFSTSLDFEPPAFGKTARYLKLNSEINLFSADDRPMFLCSRQV